MTSASVERRAVEVGHDLDGIASSIAEVNRQIAEQERRYVAALGVLGPPEIVGDHSEQEIQDAKAERYFARLAIEQLKEEREELSANRWPVIREYAELARHHRPSATITHRHVPRRPRSHASPLVRASIARRAASGGRARRRLTPLT